MARHCIDTPVIHVNIEKGILSIRDNIVTSQITFFNDFCPKMQQKPVNEKPITKSKNSIT